MKASGCEALSARWRDVESGVLRGDRTQVLFGCTWYHFCVATSQKLCQLRLVDPFPAGPMQVMHISWHQCSARVVLAAIRLHSLWASVTLSGCAHCMHLSVGQQLRQCEHRAHVASRIIFSHPYLPRRPRRKMSVHRKSPGQPKKTSNVHTKAMVAKLERRR